MTTMVASFYVHRPEDHPDAADYPRMLRLLDASCRRFGLSHVVLTDHATVPMLTGLYCFATDLPRNVLQATTESHARWMESNCFRGMDTVFVGADSLVLKDFRPFLKPADLSIIYFVHKRLWILNGFIHVPASSREKATPLFREVADDTQPLEMRTCDDMMAWERALEPRPAPPHFGLAQRRGLTVNFLEEKIWNLRLLSLDHPVGGAVMLHFRGPPQKAMMFDWAARHP